MNNAPAPNASQPQTYYHETARFHMIEAQLRANKVKDTALLAAMGEIPREMFVPPKLAGVAYLDEDLEIAPGRYLLEPMVLGRLLQEAQIGSKDNVLDLAAATGYSTAVLAKMAREVTAIEPDQGLADQAAHNFQKLGLTNARVVQMPLRVGCAAHAPYDLILINGSVDHVPEQLLNELAENGRLATVLCPTHAVEPVGEAVLFIKQNNMISKKSLFNANIKPLLEFAAKPKFTF